MKKMLLVLVLLAGIFRPLWADEGMWIPMLLEKYNIEEMQRLGFKLTAEDVYSVNKNSLKDAVVIFGRGCTGELVSDEGLLFTNHHCGFDQIQSHSAVEHDYLTNGFWAMNRSEELVNPGLSVTFLVRMDEVTARVLNGVDDTMPLADQNAKICDNIQAIKKEATQGTHYEAVVKPFYNGNQYFLFVNEVFRDIRLVGAPPSAIGKFGGDTDNWMWPRHTGDFSVFRIYANKENKPADYSPENVPYRPKRHFEISLKGVQEGDFTMVFGYPGTTYQYVPSHHISMLTETINPKLIELRTQKLEIMNRHQGADAKVRIQYASKNASTSNSWKRWIGENRGLAILNAVDRKQQYEAGFQKWVEADASLLGQYGNLLAGYEKLYTDYTPYRLASDFLAELVFRGGIETAQLARAFDPLMKLYGGPESPSKEKIDGAVEKVRQAADEFFKDYNTALDQEMTAAMLEVYRKNIPQSFLPPVYQQIDNRYKGDIKRFVDDVFKKTIFASPEKVDALLTGWGAKSPASIKKDPAYGLMSSLLKYYYDEVYGKTRQLKEQIDLLDKQYMAAQMAYEPERRFFADANFTLRVSYGQVKGYQARDGVYYQHQTTLEGIMEKDNPDIYDYRVPARLKELHQTKDYGRYALGNTVPVCFVATNHTTGGNSGSPVLNAEGQLVGINFDRAWEGVMSDLMFNPDQCRNISLDVRYVLFIIDKLAGAGYLLDEMTIKE
ncbi:MAG: S46 family peptidase [Breznakibacter sp.]